MEEQLSQQAPKALVLAFIISWFGPLVHTINKYVQKPGHEHLTAHMPDYKASFERFEQEVRAITTIEQLKDFERAFFCFICTINDKNIIGLWNESIERMSKFIVKYRKEEQRFRQYTFHVPRCLLLRTCLKTMLSTQLPEDVKGELSQLYSDFSFTAPEFNEHMNEHLRTLHVLITTKCADTELAVLYKQFCQDLESLTRVYQEGF